jgi:glycosyltransferase involved in cell wall biosynthesis
MTSISICICTFNRPHLLERVLESIANSTIAPYEIVVSEDGDTIVETQKICAKYDRVRFIKGPGVSSLSANRNTVVRAARGAYVALMDDDATLCFDFIETAQFELQHVDTMTILTGDIIEYGNRIKPTNPTFWGHFAGPSGASLRTINLNSNVIPKKAFDVTQFDELIKYGYEDMDLCSSLISKGYSIKYVPDLNNNHSPPRKSATDSSRLKGMGEAARYYTTFKRYYVWERNIAKFLVYLFLAPLHQTLHWLKKGQIGRVPSTISHYFWAIRNFREFIQTVKIVSCRSSSTGSG